MVFFCTNTKGQASLVFDLLEQALASNVNPPERVNRLLKLLLGSLRRCSAGQWGNAVNVCTWWTSCSSWAVMFNRVWMITNRSLKNPVLNVLDASLHLRGTLLRHSSGSHCVKTSACFFTNWFLFYFLFWALANPSWKAPGLNGFLPLQAWSHQSVCPLKQYEAELQPEFDMNCFFGVHVFLSKLPAVVRCGWLNIHAQSHWCRHSFHN